MASSASSVMSPSPPADPGRLVSEIGSTGPGIGGNENLLVAKAQRVPAALGASLIAKAQAPLLAALRRRLGVRSEMRVATRKAERHYVSAARLDLLSTGHDRSIRAPDPIWCKALADLYTRPVVVSVVWRRTEGGSSPESFGKWSR